MNESYEFKEAALPNITGGRSGFHIGWAGDQNGSFISTIGAIETQLNDIVNSIYTDGPSTPTGRYYSNFNASRVSSIYKDGVNTVQPPAYTLIYIMKIK